MAYDFYCTACGKRLTQELVLFDMQTLLTQDLNKRFNILKFRFAYADIRRLIAGATPTGDGYYGCTLTLADIMQIMSFPYNLNEPMLASLTADEIRKFCEAVSATVTQKKQNFDMMDDLFGEEKQEEQVETQYEAPLTIRLLEQKDETNKDIVLTRHSLRADLEILQSLFVRGSTYSFKIQETVEADNEGQPVLVGMNLQVPSGILSIENRVCYHCSSPVFSHAGTARHQAIAFIGYQRSGKTSTILALAHYVRNYMTLDLGDVEDENYKIWLGSGKIGTVMAELVDNNQRLEEDLGLYSQGIAPAKTLATQRQDAYCATFRLKNSEENKYYLLTLTDLPGELCLENGTVDAQRIYNDFPVALSCDAFIACFDTVSINPNGTGVAGWITNVCRWTDAFQNMRAVQNQVNTYVPTMFLFTKCRDLENPVETENRQAPWLFLQQSYLLKDEMLKMRENKLYEAVRTVFRPFGKLNQAYYAMMRCSAYGYEAPSKADLESGMTGVSAHRPLPKNVDILMRWLLSVSGCIPTEAEYRRDPISTNPYRLNYVIERPQLRSQNPLSNHELEESLARCVLFENPGRFDREFVGTYDEPVRFGLSKWQSRFRENGNAD